MRLILALFAVALAGCEPSGLSVTWDEAEVVVSDYERPISIHPLWPLAFVRAEVVNQTDSTATFFVGGETDGSGLLTGPGPDFPGRFLLVTSDTTLPMLSWVSEERPQWRGRPSARSVAPGDTLRFQLVTDNRWTSPLPVGHSWSSFVPEDSTEAAQFFERALNSGHIIYASRTGDTLFVARAPDATVRFRAQDQPSPLD